jgi:phospholipid transport system transporter-binding protein
LHAFHRSSARELEADCSGIAVSDSAGLTVLLDWLGHAKREGRSLRFANLPAGVLAIARISEVDELLQRGV